MLGSMPSVSVCLLFVCLLPCWLLAAFQYRTSDNSWETYAPGSLLQNLDKLTDAAVRDEPLSMPTTTTTSTTPATSMSHRKADGDEEYDVDDDDDDDDEGSAGTQQGDVDASDDVSAVDYERTYEQFVKKYFDRVDDDDDFDADAHMAATDDDDSTVESQTVSVETHDDDDDDEPVPKASTVRAKRNRCKKVRRNKQQCTICKNPRNNEVSESCSYSHKEMPEKYAFDSEKQYKRYKDDASGEEESKDAEPDDEHTDRRRYHAKHAADKVKRQKSQPQPPPQLQSEPSSLCVRKLLRQKVCYQCTDSTGKKLNRCYDAPSTHKRRNAAEQRIYKRTVAYETYEQASTNDTDATTTSATPVAQNSATNGNTTMLSTPTPMPMPTATSAPNATATGFRRQHTLYKVVRKQRLN